MFAASATVAGKDSSNGECERSTFMVFVGTGAVQWSCWNATFAMFLVQAHDTNPWKRCTSAHPSESKRSHCCMQC